MLKINNIGVTTTLQYNYYPETETLKVKVAKQIEQADFVALMAFLFEETKTTRVYTYREAVSGLIKTTEQQTLINEDKVTNVELELY